MYQTSSGCKHNDSYRYDGKTVTFWYGDHDGKRHFVTMTVREFIKALIQHIPDRNFKMIRYYGAYSRRIKRRHSKYLQVTRFSVKRKLQPKRCHEGIARSTLLKRLFSNRVVIIGNSTCVL
ncbi:MAG: hypothetical protein C4B59_08335 [Candidatus Methanogaster sp.]|uniref:Uncharacterized protein n=1 Tax=Candidatus Methanogaster sp. TaxID=3386292 RepID=A0AC61L346_9EURY|nr:MAG: hypothetical protein C4B59_08335 [ANME-2 cluster archaeon]